MKYYDVYLSDVERRWVSGTVQYEDSFSWHFVSAVVYQIKEYMSSYIWKSSLFNEGKLNRCYWLLSHRYIDQSTGDKLTLREAARAGLLAMVGAPVAAIMEAMRARQSMSRSPSRERTLSPQSTLRSNMSSRDVSFDTDRQVEINFNRNVTCAKNIEMYASSKSHVSNNVRAAIVIVSIYFWSMFSFVI